MACDLTKGRALPCRDSVGGLKAVYFVDFGGLGTVTVSATDEVTDMGGTFNAYKYDRRVKVLHFMCPASSKIHKKNRFISLIFHPKRVYFAQLWFNGAKSSWVFL